MPLPVVQPKESKYGVEKANEAAQGVTAEASPEIQQPDTNSESAVLAMLKAKRDAATAKPETAPKAVEGEPKPPVTEGEGEPEAEGEAPSEPDSGGETAQESEAEEVPIITVTVDGEARQVPLDEMKQVYSSAKSLMKKQEVILSKEREVTQLQQQTTGLANRYKMQLEALEAHMRPQVPSQEQLSQLLNAATQATDPGERAAANTRYLMAKESIERFHATQAERQRIDAELQAQESAERERVWAEQAELLKKAQPDFANPQYLQKTMGYLKSLGFDDAQIGEIDNHAAWLVIDKARKWDERNANIGTGVRKALKEAKALAPSNTQAQPNPVEQQRLAARAAFKKAPSFNSALELLKAGKR